MKPTKSDFVPPSAVASVQREIEQIQAELARIEGLRERMMQLRNWLALTEQLNLTALSGANEDLTTPQTFDSVNLNRFWAPMSTLKPLMASAAPSMKDSILAHAAEVVKAKGPMKSRAMLDELTARGVEVRGQDKVGTVATILSKSPLFVNDRRAGGWVLATNPQNSGGLDLQPSADH